MKRSSRSSSQWAAWGAAVALVLLAPAGVSFAQDPAERHRLAVDHLKRTAAEVSARSLEDIRSLADWKEKRPARRRELLSMLGLDPLPERTPLQARVTGSFERPRYRVEKVVFQSSPGLYVTGNLYLPAPAAQRLAAVLYVCGHSPHPLGAKWSYQDRAVRFAELGFVTLVLDTLEFGEVAGIHHGVHDLNMWNWLSRGYTPAGVEVWNAIRALDYLESRPEVDADRIGMTGTSGGGAVTWFTAAVDERVAAAAPVCSTYTVGSQAAHWRAAGQCDCIYYHNTFLEDFPLVGALIAPRPLLILSGRKDGDFPPDGYHEVFRRVKRIYDFFAEPDTASRRVQEIDEDVGHSDTPLFRKEACQWMNRWLKNELAPLEIDPRTDDRRETAEVLACLSQLPADAVNYRIHDHFIPGAPARDWTTLEGSKATREQLLSQLRDQVFRWFPREKAALRPRLTRNDGGWAARYAAYQDFLLDTEPGVPVRAQLLKPRRLSADTPLLLYVKRPGDSIYFLDLDELLPVLGRYTVLILNPRWTEHPVTPFEHAEIERTASWVGRTVASQQVWDVLRAVEWIVQEEQVPRSSITAYGKGEMGILVLYAALLDSRIDAVVLRDPPASHLQGPALLNVLRVTDIPEAAAAFAPRSLVVLGSVPPSFEAARQVYRLHGREDRLRTSGSLPEALEVWRR